MKKTIIVEFNGVPGSGKTTVATKLIRELELQGNDVCNFSDYFRLKKKTY